MMTPNLFMFATSELSQDAFLCWFLSWADPMFASKNPKLHHLSKTYLSSIYRKARIQLPDPLLSVRVERQKDRIDLLCIVNGETAIVFEDKVGTREHSGQLGRAKQNALKLGFSAEKIIPVYVQTGDQGDYTEVQKEGYLVFRRQDLLAVLESPEGVEASQANNILADFTSNLREIENQVQSYIRLPPSQWTWNSWKGFYSRLQQELGDGDWDYVANPSGGFLGFWWHSRGNSECQQYLQIEQDKFCFKIEVADTTRRQTLRDHWHNLVMGEGPKHGIKVRRPDRFGYGQYMTVAILDDEFRKVTGDGILDLAATLDIIRAAESVLDACPETH